MTLQSILKEPEFLGAKPNRENWRKHGLNSGPLDTSYIKSNNLMKKSPSCPLLQDSCRYILKGVNRKNKIRKKKSSE